MCRPLPLIAFCLVTVLLVSGGGCPFDDDDEGFVYADFNNGFIPAPFLSGPASDSCCDSFGGPVPVWVWPWGFGN
jgi:hypothetical protein